MHLKPFALALLCWATLPAAVAANLPCPDLADAVQIGACPTEEELKYTFNGFCSDDARMYAKDTEVCTDYQIYRHLKNVALWESADGAFHAYLSCDLPASAVKSAKTTAVAVAKQGKLTRLLCTYREGITFTHRAKAECTVAPEANCAADPAACQAICD